MEIKIDDNIPMPVVSRRRYPLGDLQVGQSFFAPGIKQNSITGCFLRYRPKKFATRSVTEGGAKGVRVWRVA